MHLAHETCPPEAQGLPRSVAKMHETGLDKVWWQLATMVLPATFSVAYREKETRRVVMVEGLSQKLKELRRTMGWTQEDLARKLLVSLSTVERWERGRPVGSLASRRALERLFRKAGMVRERAKRELERDEGEQD